MSRLSYSALTSGGFRMKQESHRQLGHYLIDHLQVRPKRRHTRAFLIGCVEPDRNPLSYLKGSLRSRWFYGHNYQNADRWIERHIRQLSNKSSWNLWDYYCMGKLIHYTSDAFTYVHNNCFTESISAHRAYEDKLQVQFLKCLAERAYAYDSFVQNPNAFFRNVHETYLEDRANIHRDCQYILNMCNWLFCQLLPETAPLCKMQLRMDYRLGLPTAA